MPDDTVAFAGYFGNQKLEQDKKYYCASQGDSVSISTCRFYVMDFQTYSNGKLLSGGGCNLIDLFDSTGNFFEVPPYIIDGVTEIRFKLGIDSATNVAGAGKDDLDPTKGMYWSWQSGYINMKLEGRSNICTKSRGEFQYHLGGYAAPYNGLQTISLKVENYEGNYVINVDVQKFLDHADLKSTPNVMSPSAKAVDLAGYAAEMFSLQK